MSSAWGVSVNSSTSLIFTVATPGASNSRSVSTLSGDITLPENFKVLIIVLLS